MPQRTLHVFTTLVALAPLGLVSVAGAQDAPAAGPEVPQAAVAVTTPSVPGPHCVLAEHHGIQQTDAQAAASFVCEDLVSRGVPVGALKADSADLAGDRFVVELRKLGSLMFVQLARRTPEGATAASARMEIHSIEEMVQAAPRLVTSVLTGAPVEATQAHDNLTGSEVREDIHSEKLTRMKFGGGVVGMGFLGADGSGLAAGIEGVLFFQSHQFGVGVLARLTLNPSEVDSIFGNLSMAGRYFLTPAEIAPFVGAGAGLYSFAVRNGEDEFGDPNFDGNIGLGAHGEVGVEFLRFSRTRVGAVARIDFPFFKAGNDYILPVGASLYMLIR